VGAGNQGAATFSGTLLPANNTYRLGGGSGTLFVTSSLADTGPATPAIIGDSRINGGGTVVLLANQTYTGGTTINGGTLQLGNGGTSGAITGSATINNGGNLVVKRSDTVTFSGGLTT